jgi:hypothetical protein
MLERVRVRARELWARVRGYRFAGEQAMHADLLRERRVSLSLMETANAADPDQMRMASDIEHDAESRLTVLLGKPRLTREEKWERDAIQAAISARRQGMAAPVLERRTDGGFAPARFLGPLGASPAMAILASPITWIVAGLALTGIQTARLNNAKGDLADARRDMRQALEERDGWKERAEQYAAGLADARRLASETADALERERARAARAAAAERRRQREIQNVLANSPDPPAWSLRDDEPVSQ